MDIYYPEFNILHWCKTGNMGLAMSTNLSEFVIDFKIDRRYGTNINEATITFDNIPHGELTPSALFKSSPVRGDSLTDNWNKIQILIDNAVQFTGFIVDYKISADNKTVEATAHDMLVLLRRGVNYAPRPSYKLGGVGAIEMVEYLAQVAGVNIDIDPAVKSNDYSINSIEIETGSMFYDLISDICESLGARLFCKKDGTITISPLFNGEIPQNLDFQYDDVIHVTSGSRSISSSQLYSSIWVSNNDDTGSKKGIMFRDNLILKYLNGWDSALKVDSKLAVNKDISQNIAKSKFMDMWRKASTADVVIADGNINMDIGKIGSVNFDGSQGVYIVTGMTASFNEETGYTDSLQIEDAAINPQIECLGDMTECGTLRQQIVDQARKYEGVPFQPGAYYRKDQGEWGMQDEALITHVLIDLNLKLSSQLTASQSTIKNDWCIPIEESELKPGDIITWQHDLSEMGIYLGDRTVIEVWGSILQNNTETAMRRHGYVVKEIPLPDDKHPVCWRLKELENCG